MNLINNAIRAIAARILGETDAKSVDVSEIDKVLAPSQPSTPQLPPEDKKLDPIEILPEYEFVLSAIANGCRVVFVTGKAGTGKSTLIRFLTVNIPNCAVVAPTALAAMNVGGATINSFFNFPLHTLDPSEVIEPRKKMLPVMERLEALIIDEASMVVPDWVDCMSNSLQYARRSNEPFGGVPVVFVGDLLQLPPVITNPTVARFYTHRYRSPYFFSADVFQNTEIIPVELTRVFRQASQEFVDLLDQIRVNSDHRDAVARFNRDCFRDRKPDRSALSLVPTNLAADTINRGNLDAIESELRYFDAIIEGKYKVDEKRFPARQRLELKVGAKVVFVKNKKPSWINGTHGTVVDLAEDTIRVEISGSGNTVTVERDTWETFDYMYDPVSKEISATVSGSFKQFPLALGWAMTIHKAQGATFESVQIDLGNGAFCTGQVYVALSRCRTIDGITLVQPIRISDVKADETILEFYRLLKPLRNQFPASVGNLGSTRAVPPS